MGAGNFVSNNCRVVPTRLTATTATVCFTATGYAQVTGIRIVNFHASSTPIIHIMYYAFANTTAYYLQANHLLLTAQALWLPLDGFAMYESDEIRVQASIASTADVLVSIAEVPGRSA